ncbi:hypothetical protein [Halomonas sp. PR-M31]|uniref:hypothetical protein n=1 Tax=Halomonas sp. PR-M31 TaxID=1471202 RepID=UPI0012E31EBB|nr:hypothetical protein [Halomonas sp. PR-M31]
MARREGIKPVVSENFVGQGIGCVSRVTKVGSGKYESFAGGVVGVFDVFFDDP